MTPQHDVDLSKYSFRIDGLTEIDRARLTAKAGAGDLQFLEPVHDETSHNELLTIAVLVGISVVPMVAAYMFGARKNEKIYFEAIDVAADGSQRVTRLVVDRTSNDPANTKIVGQILSQLKALP